MGDSDTTKLFSEIPDDKRLGILRTFHHKMYEDDTYSAKKSLCKRVTHYYCIQNKGACLVILISIAVLIIGILAICYGFLMPNLYKYLDQLENEEEKLKDSVEYTYYKDVFIIAGITMIGFGVICSSIGFFLPIYRDGNKYADTDSDTDCMRTPIIVDFELPPYDMTLEAGNYLYETSSAPESYCSESSSMNYCDSPIENGSFQTFFVQSDNAL